MGCPSCNTTRHVTCQFMVFLACIEPSITVHPVGQPSTTGKLQNELAPSDGMQRWKGSVRLKGPCTQPQNKTPRTSSSHKLVRMQKHPLPTSRQPTHTAASGMANKMACLATVYSCIPPSEDSGRVDLLTRMHVHLNSHACALELACMCN